MKYIAQPYWTEGVVRIYALPAKTLVTTVTLAHAGPNDVLVFRDPPAGKGYMMVSYDMGASGAIDIYNLADINLALPANTPPATTLALANSVVGMAVQPGTADLYVATFSDSGTPGGVFSYTHSSGYAAASRLQFSSYADAYNDVAQYCANLAFDPHGHLWMTTFQDGTPGNQFLICYAQVDRTAGSSAKFFKIGNATANLSAVTLPGSATSAAGTFYPLSQPEGLAFDPLGNLWLANNSDDFNTNGFAGNGQVNGTLLRLDRGWIDQHLLTNAGILGMLTADGYGGTQHIGAADPGVTLYYLNGARFGGLLFDGFTLYLNDQSQSNDPGHTVVWQFQTDQALSAATFAKSGIATTYPGNGQMAVFNSTPPSLLIRDTTGDTGAEPDGVAVMWESPDIGVTNTSILATLPAPNTPRASDVVDLASDGTITGASAFVYVRVTNVGTASSTGTEVLKLYWAKASAGLDWPAPWDGLKFDVTAAKPPLGGLIGARTLGTIDPGHDTVFEFPWTGVPDSALYSVDDQHFCLLARIELGGLYPFGMTYPEEVNGVAEAAVAYNTVSNSKIGWRNVTIVPPPPPGMIRRVPLQLGVLGANHAPRERVMRFAVQTLNRHGLPAHLPGTVMLHAAGRTRDRLMEPTAEGHARQHAGEGRFHLHDLAIRLAAHEVLPFHVEYLPTEQVTDFAVRVVQYVETRHGPRLVGGQTFVVGKVHGFPAR